MVTEPIVSRTVAATIRTPISLSLSNSARAEVSVFASEPISPRAEAASNRTTASLVSATHRRNRSYPGEK